MLIRVIKDWHWPDLMRQSPGGSGRWGDAQFTLDPVQECDYAVVINRVTQDTVLSCPPENVWAMSQEPPVPEYEWLQQGYGPFARVFTPETRFSGAKYVYSHGALPWHVDKSYDQLLAMPPPAKTRPLSWITSSKRGRSGHKARLAFLERISSQVEFDLWGRGFRPLADKWTGLAPYRYSLAVENHSSAYYWTEKIADCFLSWTMPIYYGCARITEFFPSESLITIDINDPDAGLLIKEVIQSDSWLRRRDAVAYARELVLQRHQFFPFIVEQIGSQEAVQNTSAAQEIQLHRLPNKYPLSPLERLRRKAAGFVRRARRD